MDGDGLQLLPPKGLCHPIQHLKGFYLLWSQISKIPLYFNTEGREGEEERYPDESEEEEESFLLDKRGKIFKTQGLKGLIENKASFSHRSR